MDVLTKEERSRRMSGVRAKGNRSTEWKFRSTLMRQEIRGWKMHPRLMPGIPDFVFPKRNLAVFIDGCFWHACPKCRRPMPQTNRAYWANKVKSNVVRARRVRRELKRAGFKVIRVWEHELRSTQSVKNIVSQLFSR